MKKQILKAALALFIVTTALPAHAFFQVEEQKKMAVPTFALMGTVPLTQIGHGFVGLVKSKGDNQKMGFAFSQLIPKDWNYFVSTSVDLNKKVIWDTGVRQDWVEAVEGIAKTTDSRILIDWKFKSVLVVASDESGDKRVYVNPRGLAKTAPLLTLPENHPMRNIEQK